MRILVSLLAGLLFGLGLAVSDMIDPARVRAFLDLASGAWDPTLAFVMGGAMIPMILAWQVARRQSAPACGTSFPGRPAGGVDARLLGGAALFGLGWGLVGFCPGPAVSAIGLGGWPVWLFVAAMAAGMALESRLPRGLRPA
jgi:hypothetical protein